MKNYDELKALIRFASPDIIEPMRYCRKCDGSIKYDEIQKIFFCTQCPYQFEEEIPEPGTIQLINVLHTLWMADPYNYYVDINEEFRTFGRNGKESVPMNVFWNKADDNLDHQSDETKQFLIDYFSIQKNVDSLMKRVELRRWNEEFVAWHSYKPDLSNRRSLPVLQPTLPKQDGDSLD